MTKGTLIRTIVLLIALINQLLTAFGKSPLPIEDADVETLISTAFTVVASVAAWWRNNSFTKPAQAADEYMQQLRSK